MAGPGIMHKPPRDIKEIEALLRQNEQGIRHGKETNRALRAELDRARSSQKNEQALAHSTAHGLAPYTNDALPTSHDHSQVAQTRPMKRSKTAHPSGHLSTAQITRSSSAASASVPSNPFSTTSTKVITPPCVPVRPPVSNTDGVMMLDYLNSQGQEPASAMLYNDSLTFETLPGRAMEIPEFLAHQNGKAVQFPSLADAYPGILPTGMTGSLLSPFDAATPAASHCSSLTSGPTVATLPMTRSNSNAMHDNVSISGQLDMVRIHSQQSHSGQQDIHSQQAAVNSMRYSWAEQGIFEMEFADLDTGCLPPYLGLADQMSPQPSFPMISSYSGSSLHQGSLPPSAAELPDGELLDRHIKMERSISQDSARSNASLNLRAKEALSRQIQTANKRQLQPRPLPNQVKHEPGSSHDAKTGKTAISKGKKYQRPKHAKVNCHQCNDYPDGFRGEHELRRHIEAKHNHQIKKWICRDPGEMGIAHQEQAVKPLTECKHCKTGKQYGAYYNAAAHLRRTHFRVKPCRKSSKGKSQVPDAPKPNDDKRGGKGGGDWPPMSELKNWMMEIMVSIDQVGALGSDDMEGPESVGQRETDDLALGDCPAPTSAIPEPYDISPYAGLGSGFVNDVSDAAFIGELSPYPMVSIYPPASMSTPPISSAGFEMSSVVMDSHLPDMHTMQPMGPGSYSTGSSPSTITPATAQYNYGTLNMADLQGGTSQATSSYQPVFLSQMGRP